MIPRPPRMIPPKSPVRSVLEVVPSRARGRVAVQSAKYSRLVTWLKVMLPLTALVLAVIVAAWPYIAANLEDLRRNLAQLDPRDARELRMVNARYSGVDQDNRPYTVTASIVRQSPDGSSLLSLEEPKADMIMKNGAWVALNGDTGVYQPGSQLLDLFGSVTLFHDRGFEFHSESARIDLASGTAEGSQPVDGQGVFGTVQAEGFRILDRGDTIVFTGKAHMVLYRDDVRQEP